MMLNTLGKLVACLFCIYSVVSGASILRNDEHQIKVTDERLDSSGSYLLSWEVDLKENRITFDVEVKTLGFVGFGISPSGSMAGADIFIAGVYENGTKYGFDMHAETNGMPILDAQQDWTLIDASEDKEKSTTFLKFSRLLNTCNDKDYPISNDTVRVIWSVGEKDDISYHGGNRGTKSLNMLMPEDEDFNPDHYLQWDVENEIVMPKQDTTYWCSVKKAPQLHKVHHVIGFEAVLTNELAVNHTHHIVVYKCNVPNGTEDLFKEYEDHEGADCYLPPVEQPLKVLDYCMGNIVFAWAKGGKRMVFPEGVGYPFPDKVGNSSYYLLEVHYDNPANREGLKFKTGIRIFYHNKTIEHEANIMLVGQDVGITATILPNQNEFVVSGHCSSQCTSEGLSKTGGEGVKIFNSLLHSHLSGRKMKVRHFRGDTELPWIDFDNHYDFNFQQSKPLRDFVQLLPGDQLTVECTYNTTWKNNQDEMCQSFLWYYPKQKLNLCASHYPVEVHFQELGVTNYSASNQLVPVYTIEEPTELAGDYETILNTKFQWNDTFIREYERRRRYNTHETNCLYWLGVGGPTDFTDVKFPDNFIKYVPEDVCKPQNEPTPTSP